jgi:uncharacterized protein (TIGR03067 family)
MKTSLVTIALVSLGLSAHAAEPTAPAEGDLARLQGRWTAMAGARKQVRVVLEVKGKEVSVAITTPQGLDFQAEGELKLDEKTTPHSLDWQHFIGPGEQPLPEIAGVYKIEGDTFTVCNGGFHGARPKEFKPGESALADLVVFHRLGVGDSLAQSPAASGADQRIASPQPGPSTAPPPVATSVPAPAGTNVLPPQPIAGPVLPPSQPIALAYTPGPVVATNNVVLVQGRAPRYQMPRIRRMGGGLFARRRRG